MVLMVKGSAVGNDERVSELLNSANTRLEAAQRRLDSILERGGVIEKLEQLQSLGGARSFAELAKAASTDRFILAEVYSALVSGYNGLGGTLPITPMLGRSELLSEEYYQEASEEHKKLVDRASEKIAVTFPWALTSTIDKARTRALEAPTKLISSSLGEIAEVLRSLESSIGEVTHLKPFSGIVSALSAGIASHMHVGALSRSGTEALKKLLEQCSTGVAALRAAIDSPPSERPSTEVDRPAPPPASPPVNEIIESDVVMPQAAQSVRAALTPRTKALVDLFQACVDPATGEIARFDFIESAYSKAFGELDLVSAKALSQDLEQVQPEADPVIDRLSEVVRARIATLTEKTVRDVVICPNLAPEMQSKLAGALAQRGATVEACSAIAGVLRAMPSEKAGWIVERVLERQAFTAPPRAWPESTVGALSNIYDNFTGLLNTWSYSEQDAREIAALLAKGLANWEDLEELQKFKNGAGSSIKKFSELHLKRPGVSDLRWTAIQGEHGALGSLLKGLNDQVRSDLLQLGVTRPVVEDLISKHWRLESGMQISETLTRVQFLHSQLSRPMVHEESESSKLVAPTFPSAFWARIASMSSQEWQEFSEKLQGVWDWCGELATRDFTALSAADLSSVEAIDALRGKIERHRSGVGEASDSTGEDTLAFSNRKFRVREALKVEAPSFFGTGNADDAATILCFLSINRTALYDQMHNRKFANKKDKFDDALRSLSQVGLIVKNGPNVYALNLSAPMPLVRMALNRSTTTEGFLKAVHNAQKVGAGA